MNLHLKNYTISTEKTCSFVLKFCYDYYHLCTRMSHNQQTNIVSSSFDRTYNVSEWSNGEEVRLMKQSMYVRILSLEKNSCVFRHVCTCASFFGYSNIVLHAHARVLNNNIRISSHATILGMYMCKLPCVQTRI
jgi:hypothetical protein